MPTYASQSTVFRGLKETLESIITDKSDYEDRSQYKSYFKVEGMDDAFEDDVEYGFTGLASETAEATEFPVGTLTPGTFTRYMARKFGIKMIVTEEAVDDNKYDKIIQAGARCARALAKTMDIDGALQLARAESALYPGGDGVALASASHTLPGGGTFSNTMATPFAPSTMGLTLAQTQADKLPGHDGTREGYLIKKVIHPVDQRFLWSRLVNSSHAPEAGEFNAINVIKHDMDISLVCVRQWTNTTTNWGAMTDAPDGFKWKFRRKPRNKSWVQDSQQLLFYQVDTRYSRRWSDARCIIWSGA
jgi:hypothetical protein